MRLERSGEHVSLRLLASQAAGSPENEYDAARSLHCSTSFYALVRMAPSLTCAVQVLTRTFELTFSSSVTRDPHGWYAPCVLATRHPDRIGPAYAAAPRVGLRAHTAHMSFEVARSVRLYALGPSSARSGGDGSGADSVTVENASENSWWVVPTIPLAVLPVGYLTRPVRRRWGSSSTYRFPPRSGTPKPHVHHGF